MPGSMGTSHTKFVGFIKTITNNWHLTIHELMDGLDRYDVSVEEFFELERNTGYKFSSFLNNLNIIQQEVFPNNKVDLAPFIAKVSHVFLPPNVYTLEEYGLPRMISKKIHNSRSIDLEDEAVSIHEILGQFTDIGLEILISKTNDLDDFDKYILKHFYDGILVREIKGSEWG